jgi:Zn-dependent protease
MLDLSSAELFLGAVWYAVFVVSTTFHEAAHAFAALKLGDRTAYLGGQVTVNPLPHIRREPFGMVVVPIVSFLMGGWMIGWASAPYDVYWATRYPRRAALMALAGPAANLLLAVLAGLLIRAGIAAGFLEAPERLGSLLTGIVTGTSEGFAANVATILSIAFSLNLILLVFNLLPLPPLDGSAALPLILPARTARRYQELLREPIFALLGLVVAWKLFGTLQIVQGVLSLALKALYPS